MKKSLLLLVLTVVCGTVSAQDLIVKQNAETIDGKVLRVGGSKIEYTKAGDHAGPVYTISTNEVLVIKYGDGREESFKKAASTRPKRIIAQYRDSYPHYQGEVAVAYGLGIGDITDAVNTDRIMVETVHGVRISPYAFIGVGAGFNYFYGFDNYLGMEDYSDNGAIVTAFANAKGYYPVSQGASLYLSLDLGGAFGVMNLLKEHKDMYVAAGPGIAFGNASSRMRADIGVRFQHMGDGTNAVLFRLGFVF